MTSKSRLVEGVISSGTKHPQVSISKAIENLESLLNHSMLTISSIVNEFEKMIYGDSSDIICTLVNSLVTNLHEEIRV